MKMSDLAPELRPRERLMAGHGEELGDAELLALIWGSSGRKGRNIVEMAQEILTRSNGLSGLMALGLRELSELPGLGPARVGQLWAVQEMARRSMRGLSRARVSSPREAGEFLMPRCMGLAEEHFGLLALDAKSRVIAERILSKGTALGTMVTPREFFREALRYGAVSALAFHNHPSGNPEPSPQDTALTERLRESGRSLGVELADHIIVGAGSYYSFRSAGGWDK